MGNSLEDESMNKPLLVFAVAVGLMGMSVLAGSDLKKGIAIALTSRVVIDVPCNGGPNIWNCPTIEGIPSGPSGQLPVILPTPMPTH